MIYDEEVHSSIQWDIEKPLHEISMGFKYRPSFVEYVVNVIAQAEVIQEVILGDQETPDDFTEEIKDIRIDELEIWVEEVQIDAKDCPLTKEQVKDLLIEWCG